MAVSGGVGRGQAAHLRPANFGQLNSAIARGDLAQAQNAFTALNESTAPAAMAAKARGSLAAVGAAISSGDIEAAKKSLADFRAGRIIEPAPAAEPAPVEAAASESPVVPEPSSTALPAQIATTEQIIAMLADTEATARSSV